MMFIVKRDYPRVLSAEYNKLTNGFSLVELMVGLVIGLLAILVIMQVFSVFEEQKRATGGNSDAQTNGSIALYTIQRDVQLAGYGLPLYDKNNMPLKCTTVSPDQNNNKIADVDHDGDGNGGTATLHVDLLPIQIVDGVNSTDSDTVIVGYGTTNSGGVPVEVFKLVSDAAINTNMVDVSNNMGCQNGDIAYIVSGNSCYASRVNDANLADHTTKVILTDATGAASSALPVNSSTLPSPSRMACLGAWNQYSYRIANNSLVRTVNGVDTVMVSGVVNMQAQYGISSEPKSNQITAWVNAGATGHWDDFDPDNPPPATCDANNANRNCIKAVRIAVVARNGQLEKNAVSEACSSFTQANPKGVCAWDATTSGINGAKAPTVDLSNISDWQRYRYRVFDVVIPLRNIVWTKDRI